MKNVSMALSGNLLTITIDLSQVHGPSSTGKTVIVASSEGAATIPGSDVKLTLSAYKKP